MINQKLIELPPVGADIFQVKGAVIPVTTMILSPDGIMTPPTLLGITHDYDPVDGLKNLSNVIAIRMSADGNIDLTGIEAPPSVSILYLINAGNGGSVGDIKLKNENAGSLAANRFALSADVTIKHNQVGVVLYDTVSVRWQYVSVV